MKSFSRSSHDRRVFPAVLIVVVAVLAISENHGFAQSKPAAQEIPEAPPIAVPVATPPPRNPLWESPDAGRIGVESAEALHRKYHLPANPHGSGQVSPIGVSAVFGLLALVAVALVLGQRSGRERDRKSRRKSRRQAP